MKKKNKNIIGSGFLSSKFLKYEKLINKLNICIYAAGVSNSLNNNRKELNKDFNRLKNFRNFIGERKIIYISTCSIYDPNRNKSSYVKNKLKIEKFIRNNFKNYMIIRFPELVGSSSNKNTLINFFYNNILSTKKFTAFVKAKRNLLDVEDAIKLTFFFIKKRKFNEINIANIKYYNSLVIIKNIETICKIAGTYSKNKKDLTIWKINNSVNNNILRKLKLKFDKKYLPKIIKKYYT